MSFGLLVVVMFAAVNPFAAAMAVLRERGHGQARPGLMTSAFGAGIALGLLVLAAVGAEKLLGFLEVEPETFRVAAGVVMAAIGLRIAVFGAALPAGKSTGLEAAVFPLAIPLIAGPAVLMAAVSLGADEGVGRTVGAGAIAVGIAFALLVTPGTRQGGALDALARLTGALLVAAGAGLIVDGVRAI